MSKIKGDIRQNEFEIHVKKSKLNAIINWDKKNKRDYVTLERLTCKISDIRTKTKQFNEQKMVFLIKIIIFLEYETKPKSTCRLFTWIWGRNERVPKTVNMWCIFKSLRSKIGKFLY